jgi:hypothetical protein
MTSTFREEVSGALDSSGVNLSDLAELRPANIRRNVAGTITGMLDASPSQTSAVTPPGSTVTPGSAEPQVQPELWAATPDDPSLN